MLKIQLYINRLKNHISFNMEQITDVNEKIINLFIEKEFPLSLALTPEKLKCSSLNWNKTNLDIVKNFIKTGKGEILSYNEEGVLTEERIANYNEMYKTFIETKQLFNFYGIEVNGAIGLAPVIRFKEEQEKWVSSFYDYSDAYGLTTKYKYIYINSVLFHSGIITKRYFEAMKEYIDKDNEE